MDEAKSRVYVYRLYLGCWSVARGPAFSKEYLTFMYIHITTWTRSEETIGSVEPLKTILIPSTTNDDCSFLLFSSFQRLSRFGLQISFFMIFLWSRDQSTDKKFSYIYVFIIIRHEFHFEYRLCTFMGKYFREHEPGKFALNFSRSQRASSLSSSNFERISESIWLSGLFFISNFCSRSRFIPHLVQFNTYLWLVVGFDRGRECRFGR